MAEVEGAKVGETPQCSLTNVGDGGVGDGEGGEVAEQAEGWTKCELVGILVWRDDEDAGVWGKHV